MNNLKKKLKKQGGFTLVEMLIVVAIIAILVAVSIPMVSGALEKARQATDDANLRAAKAEGAIYYLSTVADTGWTAADTVTYAYDANAGKLLTDGGTPTDYGKSGNNGYVNVTITKGGDITVSWVAKAVSP